MHAGGAVSIAAGAPSPCNASYNQGKAHFGCSSISSALQTAGGGTELVLYRLQARWRPTSVVMVGRVSPRGSMRSARATRHSASRPARCQRTYPSAAGRDALQQRKRMCRKGCSADARTWVALAPWGCADLAQARLWLQLLILALQALPGVIKCAANLVRWLIMLRTENLWQRCSSQHATITCTKVSTSRLVPHAQMQIGTLMVPKKAPPPCTDVSRLCARTHLSRGLQAGTGAVTVPHTGHRTSWQMLAVGAPSPCHAPYNQGKEHSGCSAISSARCQHTIAHKGRCTPWTVLGKLTANLHAPIRGKHRRPCFKASSLLWALLLLVMLLLMFLPLAGAHTDADRPPTAHNPRQLGQAVIDAAGAAAAVAAAAAAANGILLVGQQQEVNASPGSSNRASVVLSTPEELEATGACTNLPAAGVGASVDANSQPVAGFQAPAPQHSGPTASRCFSSPVATAALPSPSPTSVSLLAAGPVATCGAVGLHPAKLDQSEQAGAEPICGSPLSTANAGSSRNQGAALQAQPVSTMQGATKAGKASSFVPQVGGAQRQRQPEEVRVGVSPLCVFKALALFFYHLAGRGMQMALWV